MGRKIVLIMASFFNCILEKVLCGFFYTNLQRHLYTMRPSNFGIFGSLEVVVVFNHY